MGRCWSLAGTDSTTSPHRRHRNTCRIQVPSSWGQAQGAFVLQPGAQRHQLLVGEQRVGGNAVLLGEALAQSAQVREDGEVLLVEHLPVIDALALAAGLALNRRAPLDPGNRARKQPRGPSRPRHRRYGSRIRRIDEELPPGRKARQSQAHEEAQWGRDRQGGRLRQPPWTMGRLAGVPRSGQHPGGLLPVQVQLAVRGRAVTQVKVDEALVRNANLLSE